MEGWTRKDLVAYQDERLAHLVAFASKEVPYYRDLFQERRIDPREIRSAADLKRLPLLAKSTIRAGHERFIAASSRRSVLSMGRTSGTTGAPLTLYRDLASITWEKERLSRWRRRAGVLPGERRVVIRGDHFIPTGERTDRPWLVDRLANLLLVSSYHLSGDTLPAIVQKIRDFSPAALEGYPGALQTLAQHVSRTQQNLAVRAVFTSSEQVYEHQRAAMKRAFGADVFDQYGMAERAALASECDRHRLHLDMECTIVEILRPDGGPCAPGQSGEVVGTSLTNFAMPLIRYRTGDVATLGETPCSCGLDRPFLAELEGRDDDFVVGANGRRFSPTILTFPFETAEGVEESQLVQLAPGCLLVRLVPAPGFPDPGLGAAQALIARDLEERLGGGMSITFEIVDFIRKGPNGKFKWIVSEEENVHERRSHPDDERAHERRGDPVAKR
jgi:phenylacetate-CoA ligase